MPTAAYSVQLGPHWFFGLDASLEAAVAVIAFFIAVSALRIFKVTKDMRYFYFMSSFVLLTLSFLSRAITDMLLEELFMKLPKEFVAQLFFAGYVGHILLALLAYIVLFSVTHKIKDKRVVALLFLIAVPSLLVSSSYFLTFYGLSTIFLAFITFAYYENCKKVKRWTSRLVFVGFAILTLAQLFFLLDAVTHRQGYVLAQLSQGFGYLVLLIALLRTLWK